MYLKPTNRTFVIIKYRDRRGVLCRSKDGNFFNGTSKLVFGNPNATSNNTYKSFPIKEGSVDVAGKNLTRFFALKNDELNTGNVLVDTMNQCRPIIMESGDEIGTSKWFMNLFYDYQVGGELPPSTWILPQECYKKNSDGFVEDNNKKDNNMLRSTMKKISYFSTFDFAL